MPTEVKEVPLCAISKSPFIIRFLLKESAETAGIKALLPASYLNLLSEVEDIKLAPTSVTPSASFISTLPKPATFIVDAPVFGFEVLNLTSKPSTKAVGV